jgi:hypothetical protein
MQITSPMPRSRVVYAALTAATIVLGLASRRFGTVLPDAVRLYTGDALWAAAVYFAAATIWPRARVLQLAIGALAFSFAIEASQLYRAPWIDGVRATRLGALVLGYGFLWSDLVCYAVGVAAAGGVDVLASRGRERRASLPPF